MSRLLCASWIFTCNSLLLFVKYCCEHWLFQVPRVFINGQCIGGGSDTKQLHQQGKLLPLIEQCRPCCLNLAPEGSGNGQNQPHQWCFFRSVYLYLLVTFEQPKYRLNVLNVYAAVWTKLPVWFNDNVMSIVILFVIFLKLKYSNALYVFL